jgi:hypothetical protein
MNDQIESLQLNLQTQNDRVEIFKERWIEQVNINEALELKVRTLERQINLLVNQSNPLNIDAALNVAQGNE